MLTINTQIPTLARPHIRALVKAHPGWLAFITSTKGKLSAQARNSELIEFALMHPSLAAEIELILQASHNVLGSAPANNVNPDDLADDIVADMTEMGPDETSSGGEKTFGLDDILGAVDQFLSPLVRGEIGKALGPVIDAANRGPVEVERIVEVAAGEGPRVVAGPKARRDKRTTFRALFPSKAKDAWRDAPITLWAGVAAPAIDPFYVVNHLQMALAATALERGTNFWLNGPAGTGKSTLPEQLCAAVGRPITRIGMTRQTDVETLVGGFGLVDGATVWQDGVLVKAMRCPGMVILIDELTFAPAGVQAIIQLVADDHRTLTLPTGEVVKAADGVVFCVADNTNGSGDEGGLYAGTNVSNAALVTRFKRMITINYLTPTEEAEALANHTSCPLPAARHLADFVAECRRLPTLAGVVISLRQMVGFTQTVQDGFSSKEAFITAISSRMPATERATIEAKADLAWNSTFEALIHSKAVPATPSDSAASKAFGDNVY